MSSLFKKKVVRFFKLFFSFSFLISLRVCLFQLSQRYAVRKRRKDHSLKKKKRGKIKMKKKNPNS